MAAAQKKRGQTRAPEVKFAQHLAANEKKVRDRAVKKLRQWLQARSQAKGGGFVEDDMLKIWKGLFYCMWMSDKPLVQEELATTLSRLLHCLKNEDTVFLFIRVFFKTMIREWNGIDHLRMDKFFMLIRKMVSQCLEYLRQNQWDAGVTDRFMSIMTEGPMSISAEEVPDGIRAVVSLTILLKIFTNEDFMSSAQLSPQELLPFLTPFFMMLKESDNMTLLQTVGTGVLEEIINRADFTVPARLQRLEEDEDDDDEEQETREDDDDEEEEEKATLRFDHAAIADQLFMLASQKDTRSRNRRIMYNWVKKFKDAASGIFPDQHLLKLLDSESDEDEGEESRRKAPQKGQDVPMDSAGDGQEENGRKRKKKRKKQTQRAKKAEQSGEVKDVEMNCTGTVEEVDMEALEEEHKTLIMEQATNGDNAFSVELGAQSVKGKKRKKGKDKMSSEQKTIVGSTDAKLRKKEIASDDAKSKVKPRKRSAYEVSLDDAKQEALQSVAGVDDSCVEVVVLPGPGENDIPSEERETVEGKSLTKAPSHTQSPEPQAQQSPRLRRKKKRYFEGVIEDGDNNEVNTQESSGLHISKKQKKKSSFQLTNGPDEDMSTHQVPAKTKQQRKKKNKESFVSFEKFVVTPPSFFKKAASKAMPRSEPKPKKTPKKLSSNRLSAPSSEPIEGKKHVAFALSKNTTQEFRKNEKSLAVSPAPVAIPYDAARQPEQGVLKPSTTTPPARRKAKRRAMAADFF